MLWSGLGTMLVDRRRAGKNWMELGRGRGSWDWSYWHCTFGCVDNVVVVVVVVAVGEDLRKK